MGRLSWGGGGQVGGGGKGGQLGLKVGSFKQIYPIPFTRCDQCYAFVHQV